MLMYALHLKLNLFHFLLFLIKNKKIVPCELKVPGLQSKYLLEKCTKTRSLSCVSPVRENCLRNFLNATSSVSFSKLKYFKYSSATALLKSLLKMKNIYILLDNDSNTFILIVITFYLNVSIHLIS